VQGKLQILEKYHALQSFQSRKRDAQSGKEKLSMKGDDGDGNGDEDGKSNLERAEPFCGGKESGVE
jgi:hypothetical protein